LPGIAIIDCAAPRNFAHAGAPGAWATRRYGILLSSTLRRGRVAHHYEIVDRGLT
jgi:hypothetical protein